jgi:hypothetical protein
MKITEISIEDLENFQHILCLLDIANKLMDNMTIPGIVSHFDRKGVHSWAKDLIANMSLNEALAELSYHTPNADFTAADLQASVKVLRKKKPKKKAMD